MQFETNIIKANVMDKNTTLLEKAIQIAVDSHAGHKDKAGAPYILHPLRVMMAMETHEQMIVAVLHDVVEDTNTTMDDLRQAGFPETVLEAVGLLTHKETDSYESYVRKIKPNPLAKLVKLADLRDNYRIDRLPNPCEEDIIRLKKYRNAYRILTE
jgi:(p)ppGpp synthase/HD superfamily hydrolase